MRSGEWLTAARMRAYSLILLGLSVLVFAGWIAVSDGLIDRNGQPIGTDFSNVYAAGTLTWQGRSAEAYAPALQHAAEKAVFDGREVPFYGWHYPPFFFAVAVLVAAVPYAWGLAIWLVASFAAYLAAIRAILPRQETLLVAAAFPAVFVNVGHGQNGFLTAALLGGALHWLDRRPWLAGVLIGLLAYKPQFGVLIPIALLAGGRWRTIGAAAATVAALVAVSFALLGSGIWHAFADSMNFTQTVVLEQGGTGWQKIQSIFAGVRAWGASVPTAYAAQATLLAMLAASSGLAMAQRFRLRTQGRGAGAGQPARDALCARLRPRGARGRDRIFRAARAPPRFSRFRNQPACRGLDRAAVVAQHRRGHLHTPGAIRRVGPLCLRLAARGARSREPCSWRARRRASVILIVPTC